MKVIFFYLILCVISLSLNSCVNDSEDNPIFGENELYIYTEIQGSVSGIAGTPTTLPIVVSPADGSVSVRWLLNNEVIGTEPTLNYTFTEVGTFTLRIEAQRGEATNYREFTLTVTEP